MTRVEILQFGPFRLDLENLLLYRDGAEVALVSGAARVLLCVARHPGEVVARERLLEPVWSGVHVSEQSLTESMALLREALEDDPREPEHVQTVYGRGHRFLAEVEAVPHGTEPTMSVASLRQRRRGTVVGALALVVIALATTILTGESGPRLQVRADVELVFEGAGPDRSASLVPDGTRVAYVPAWGSRNVTIHGLDRGHEITLTSASSGGFQNTSFAVASPVWSPGGERVAHVWHEASEDGARGLVARRSSFAVVALRPRGARTRCHAGRARSRNRAGA